MADAESTDVVDETPAQEEGSNPPEPKEGESLEKTNSGEAKVDENKDAPTTEKKEGEPDDSEKKEGEPDDSEKKEAVEGEEKKTGAKKSSDDEDSDSDDDVPQRSKPPARAPPARPPPRIDPNKYDRETWSTRPEITRTWEVEEAPDVDEVVPMVEVNFTGTPVAAKYEIGAVIGRGPFSVVKKGKDKASGKVVVVKGMSTESAPQLDAEMLKASLVNMKEIGTHPNVVEFVESFTLASNVFAIVMELVEPGELAPHLVSTSSAYTEATARKYAKDLLSALEHVHSKGYVHRDVTYENLLLSSKGDVKLAGFSLAKKCDGDIDNDGICGALYTQAPEVVQHQKIGKAIDIWAAGCIIYLLLSGRLPFYDDNNMRLNMKIRKGEFEFSQDFSAVSNEAKDLIKKMIVPDPKGRLTAQTALAHAWFSSTAGSALPSVKKNLKQLLDEQAQ